MLPSPIEHRFQIDHEPYCLVEWDRGGERKIRMEYAMAIAAAPSVIEAMDGINLYAEAVARVCLREAPDIFWETRPAVAGANGTPTSVVTFDHVPRALWEAFRKEVDAFLALIFPALPAEPESASARRPDESPVLAAAQAVSPVLRGRAE